MVLHRVCVACRMAAAYRTAVLPDKATYPAYTLHIGRRCAVLYQPALVVCHKAARRSSRVLNGATHNARHRAARNSAVLAHHHKAAHCYRAHYVHIFKVQVLDSGLLHPSEETPVPTGHVDNPAAERVIPVREVRQRGVINIVNRMSVTVECTAEAEGVMCISASVARLVCHIHSSYRCPLRPRILLRIRVTHIEVCPQLDILSPEVTPAVHGLSQSGQLLRGSDDIRIGLRTRSCPVLGGSAVPICLLRREGQRGHEHERHGHNSDSKVKLSHSVIS